MVDKGSFEYLTEYDDHAVSHQTVGNVLSVRAECLPEEIYAIYGHEDDQLSFKKMNERANEIGSGLVDVGISHQEKVSVMIDHPLETVKVFFGLLKSGAVYCPINTDYKGDPLAYQLNDTDPELLIVDEKYIERINNIQNDLDTHPKIIIRRTDEDGPPLSEAFESMPLEQLSTDDTTTPEVDVSWDDEASIIYTSGTTGRPKGCVVTHRYWLSGMSQLMAQVLDEGDIAHNPFPLNHISAVGICVFMLVAGGKVTLWDQFSPRKFWDRVNKYDATYGALLSVMIPWLTNQEKREDDNENTLKCVAMQPLPDNWEEIATRFGFDIVPMTYAQTETAFPVVAFIHATKGVQGTPEAYRRGAHPEEMIEQARGLNVPVLNGPPDDRFMGRPVPSMAEATVLDENGESLPPGEVGEMALRPKQPALFMNRYYNKPKKTVEAFQDLWLHTGDAVYRDEENNYFFVDRIGDVIRRRGENISSLQVQDAVNSHNAVEEAAVFPVPAEEGGEDAICVAIETVEGVDSTQPSPSIETLEEHLADRLPDFMIPDHYQFLEELPTTTTNKIEKHKLRERYEDINM